ncbi:MAG TPA: HD domain-containing phosphohydrolase [Solirubrobacteraceae bacterium]|nr:HD domain-containing phosphohydrolase [Solirubrobacteraceae bacterium]
MPASKLTRYLFWVAEILLLAATAGMAVWLSRPEEWQPLLLVVLLLVFALIGERFSVQVSNGQLSASTVVIVLAMGLLGPVPAAVCAVAGQIVTSASRRLPPAQWLSNLAAHAVPAFAGGLLVRVFTSQVPGVNGHHPGQSVIFGLIVFGAYIVLIVLNLFINGLDLRLEDGNPFLRQMRDFLPLLPAELAAGALATSLVVAYVSVGIPALFAAVVLLLIFRHLMVALLRSEDRAEQLQARSRQLVGLQLGVLRTLVRALGMRDKTAGRHAAAAALYAKALAIELGCSEEEQDMIHAAGLLHEIGKFTWPDRVLHAEVIQDDDLALVKNHPQEGSILVGALDGYGPVADAILYHRERVDGRGYPAGLIGKEIPLGSRILAICSTYDTITAPDGYRSPMAPTEAMDELRHGAKNGQFDSELVESFIALLEREGPAFAQDADFETELQFERRVREMAEPRSADYVAHAPRSASAPSP